MSRLFNVPCKYNSLLDSTKKNLFHIGYSSYFVYKYVKGLHISDIAGKA